MSSNGLMVTVVGWAASTPREVIGDGVPFTSFRVATTPRYFDNKKGEWAEGRTEWLTVKAFKDVAFNVAASIRKGDPVLVQGRLRTEEWISDQGPRTGLVVDAHALGHDLTRGRGSFARSVHVASSQGGPGPGDEEPTSSTDLDDPWATEVEATADATLPVGVTP